jgi:putative transcriptional regulator
MKNCLSALREKREWTQGDLARELNVSRQTVNSIETGRYDPSLPLAFAIADLFRCAIEDVFTADGADSAKRRRAT